MSEEISELKVECGKVEVDDVNSNWGKIVTLKQVKLDLNHILDYIPEQLIVDYLKKIICYYPESIYDVMEEVNDSEILDYIDSENIIHYLLENLSPQELRKLIKTIKLKGEKEKILIAKPISPTKYILLPNSDCSEEIIKSKNIVIFNIVGDIIPTDKEIVIVKVPKKEKYGNKPYNKFIEVINKMYEGVLKIQILKFCLNLKRTYIDETIFIKDF